MFSSSLQHPVQQFGPQARRHNPLLPYVQIGVTSNPTYALSDSTPTPDGVDETITFSGGNIEVDGLNFSFDGVALNFEDVASLVSPGERFIISAVPSYLEPADQATAEALGVRYTVANDPNGDGIATEFRAAAVSAEIEALGGYSEVYKRIVQGYATAADREAYENYEQDRFRFDFDNRYGITVFRPQGIELVLTGIEPQANFGNDNPLLNETEARVNFLAARVESQVYSIERKWTTAQVEARFGTTANPVRHFLIDEAVEFTSAADRDANVSGTPLTPNGSGVYTLTASRFYRVREKAYPSYSPEGQRGNLPRITKFLDKRQFSGLGRVNPIYLGNNVRRVEFPQDKLSPLTMYAGLCHLVEVTLGTDLELTVVKDIFAGFHP